MFKQLIKTMKHRYNSLSNLPQIHLEHAYHLKPAGPHKLSSIYIMLFIYKTYYMYYAEKVQSYFLRG